MKSDNKVKKKKKAEILDAENVSAVLFVGTPFSHSKGERMEKKNQKLN